MVNFSSYNIALSDHSCNGMAFAPLVSLPSVDFASGDEGEPETGNEELSNVAAVSSDESEVSAVPPQRKRNRATKQLSYKDRLCSKDYLTALLNKKCVRCSKRCFERFKAPDQFERLLSFRQTFANLPKQDQDQIAARSCIPFNFESVSTILCSGRYKLLC